MPKDEAARFTIGVFQDAASARSGIEALKRHGFPTEALTVAGKATAEIASLLDDIFGPAAIRFEYPELGRMAGAGSLLAELGTSQPEAPAAGLTDALRRLGFQAHDGRIFETLVGRGGVLVAVRGESRVADALAVLHNYGGGNAAIGAWQGRL